MTRSDPLELLIPPPVVCLVIASVMLLTVGIEPTDWPQYPRLTVTAGLALAGAMLSGAGLRALHNAGSTIASTRPQDATV